MSSDLYRRQVQQHQQEIARLQRDKGSEATRVANYQKQANSALQSAQRASNASSAGSRYREAERYQDQATNAQKKVAEVDRRIAQVQDRMIEAQKSLVREEEREARERAWKERRAVDERERQESRRIREYEDRMKRVHKKLGQHDEMHQQTQEDIRRLSLLPEKIVVLFMASSPLDQQPLRLDEEARAVNTMIRMSKHREAVNLETRWAARSLDVLQAINELEPTILHFSGHGSENNELVFQDAAGRTTLVSKEAIAAAISTASKAIRVVFFNSCFSGGQAEAVVKYVDVAVGMNTSIGDEAAREFAAQFYSAIGFGLSIEKAFNQARAALMLLGIPEQDTPELFVAAGVDPGTLILVRPEPE